MWTVAASLFAICAAILLCFRGRVVSSRAFGIGLLALFGALLLTAEPITSKYSPRTTVTGRVESVSSAESTSWRHSRTEARLVLELGGGSHVTLLYDPAQETFGPTQMIHVTYTDWDDRIRTVHPLWRPDIEVLSQERDTDAAIFPFEIAFLVVVAVVCFAVSSKKRDADAAPAAE